MRKDRTKQEKVFWHFHSISCLAAEPHECYYQHEGNEMQSPELDSRRANRTKISSNCSGASLDYSEICHTAICAILKEDTWLQKKPCKSTFLSVKNSSKCIY